MYLQVVHASSDWPSWLSDQCSQCGWAHSSGSPLVWRELIDRGGKGLYLGGLQEFEHYASHYHGITPATNQELEEAIARENQETLLSLKLEQESAPKPDPLRVCVTNASSQIAYHLLQQIATGKVCGEDKLVAIHLYDSDAEKREELEGVALDLVDLASPVLYEVRVAESVKDAVDSVSMAFILDYPYQPVVVGEESNTCTQQPEDPGVAQGEGQVEGEGEKVENEDTANIQDSPSKEEPISSTTDDSSKLEGPSRGDEEGEGGGEEAEAKKPSSAGGVEKQASHSALPVIEEEHTIATDTARDKDGDTVKNAESASSSQAKQAASDAPPTEKLITPLELAAAARLYHCYGATMDFCSQKDIQVVVCGRYGNTGAALMANAVSSINKANFIAAPSLAEQQAKAIIASKVELNRADIAQVAVWGHSCGEKAATDLSYVRVKHFPGAVMGPDPFDLPLTRCIFQIEWLENKYHRQFEARHKRMEGYRKNGCALVEAMGLVKLANQWRDGDEEGSGWSSVGMVSTEEGGGVYGIPVGVAFCQPAQCSEGVWKPVVGLPVSDKIKVRTKLLMQKLMFKFFQISQEVIGSQISSLKAELDCALKAISKDNLQLTSD